MSNIFEAIYENDMESIRKILKSNLQAADVKNMYGRYPLYNVVSNSNKDMVKLVLEANPKAALIMDYNGWYPLHYAAKSNQNIEVVELIYKEYPQAAIDNECCGTPLHSAVFNKNVEVAKYLYYMNPQAIIVKDYCSRIPLHLVEYTNNNINPDVKKFLQKATDGTLVNAAIKIQAAWRECRYNPDYKMCQKIQIEQLNIIYQNNLL